MRRALALALVAVVGLLGAAVAPAGAGSDSTEPTGDTEAGSTIIIVDTSGSMAKTGRFDAAQSAVTSYVSALPPDLAVGLVAFSGQPRVVLQPTTERAKVYGAVARLTLRGHTSLYDSVLMGIDKAGRSGTRNIVLITDGQDSSSRNSLATTLKKVRKSDVRVDAVDVRPGQKPGPELRKLTRAGNGTVVTAADAAQLARLMAELSRTTRGDTEPAEAVPAAPITRTLVITLAVFFAGLALALLLVLYVVAQRTSRTARIRRMVGAYGLGATHASEESDPSLAGRSPVVGAVFGVAGRMAASEALGGRLVGLVLRANLRMKPAEWLVVEFSAGLIVAAALGLATGNMVVGGLVGLLLGVLGAHGVLMFLAERRTRAFGNRLPDALQLLASSISSGFGLAQACDAVARDGPQPVADEFTKAMVDVRLGLPLTDALGRVAVRMRSPDLKMTVMSIGIQTDVGGNLAEILRTTVATMRERAYLRRQVRTLSAEGRLSAYILIALPIGMAAYLLLVRRDYIRPLYTEPIGLLMAAGAIVSVLFGSFVMRKMVKVEV